MEKKQGSSCVSLRNVVHINIIFLILSTVTANHHQSFNGGMGNSAHFGELFDCVTTYLVTLSSKTWQVMHICVKGAR